MKKSTRSAGKILISGIIAVLLAVLVSAGVEFGVAEELSKFGNPVHRISINKTIIHAEVVRSPEKLWQGLSGREELPEGTGMLFVMPAPDHQHFCMRGMKLPLDFIWIDRNNIVGLTLNISPLHPGTMSSPAPVKYVLEVPAGFCERHGLKIGDPVRFLP